MDDELPGSALQRDEGDRLRIHARAVVKQLVADAGFDPVDAGPLINARLLEPMMLLWISAARSLGTRDLAFTLLRRSPESPAAGST